MWNSGNLDELDALVMPTYQRHGTGGVSAPDLASLKKIITMYRTAFPDATVGLDQSYYLQDRGFFVWTFVGTNTGPGDIPAAGKAAKVSGVSIVKYDGDKVADELIYFDQGDMNKQLGYVETSPAATK